MFRIFIVFVLILAVFGGYKASEAQQLGESGNPLPRFVSIAAERGFMRTGPGRKYPIDWVYKRQNLPLKVVEEYEAWRRVVDFEGTEGWMHRSLLSNRRTAMIIGGAQVLRSKPSLNGKINANLQKGVIVTLEECGIKWCKLEHPEVTGWLPRAGIYGILRDEVFD